MNKLKRKSCRVRNHITLVLSALLCMVMFSVIILPCSLAQDLSKKKQVIIFGGDYEYSPFEYLDEKGNPKGFHIDLMRAIGDVMEFEVNFQLGAWDQVYEDFKQKRINVLAIFYSKDRDQWVDFSNPHTILYYEIYVRQKAHQIRSLDELRDHEVIVQKSALMHEYLQKTTLASD